MVNFSSIIQNLVDNGFYEVVLPFILVYVVVFAILEKSKIFKSDDDNSHVKSVNSVISLVFALFAVASIQTVMYIQSLITNIVLFLIFILVVLIALGFVFGEDYLKHILKTSDGNVRMGVVWTIAAVVIIVAVSALIYATGMWGGTVDFFEDILDFDSDTFWTVVVFAAIGGVMYMVTKEPKKD